MLEINKIYKLSDVWDGNGEVPEDSYSYPINDMDYITYFFQVLEENENPLDTLVKITRIELT